jgi:hypothetical protein
LRASRGSETTSTVLRPELAESAGDDLVDDLEDAAAEAVDPDEVVDAEADTAGLEPGKPCCSAMD